MVMMPFYCQSYLKRLAEISGSFDPEWASYTLGVFVCQSCSGLHRNISQISKVKSVLLVPWSDAEVEFMASNGNDAAKAKYEQKVPVFYYRPTHTDCQLLREQWIRARYERKEFVCVERQEPYSAGKTEYTHAHMHTNKHALVMMMTVMMMYTLLPLPSLPVQAREPKALMKIHTLNASFQPGKIGQPHGLQVTYLKNNSTRNIFVYHKDGNWDWLHTIIWSQNKTFLLHVFIQLVPKLTRNYIKEGYMEKTGPKVKSFNTYTLDAYARGEVFIGSKENSYIVLPGLPPSTQGYHWQFGVTIVTPDRKFLFTCETEEEQQDWMAAFQGLVNRPMLPQEYQTILSRATYKSN
uniref:ArfGAP with dual PH domains 1 n=1 Tax=Hucho hucho TaxID=62062 RepID=A0A4W5Q0M1_9TELE